MNGKAFSTTLKNTNPNDAPGWADNIERLLVIVFLGVVTLGCIGIAGFMALNSPDAEIPDMLQIIGATAVGALGGMLSNRGG